MLPVTINGLKIKISDMTEPAKNLNAGKNLFETRINNKIATTGISASCFENTAHPDLELGIVTNLAINTNKLENICERFKKLLVDRKLKRIDITCSIDCWGAEQEYVRYGLNLVQWEKNFEYLLSKKWITLNMLIWKVIILYLKDLIYKNF